MARLLFNNVHSRLAVALDADDTTIELEGALQEGSVNLPTLTGGDTILLGIEDEVVELTAYTAGATTGTISRGYGDTLPAAHDVGAEVANVITKDDVSGGPSVSTAVLDIYNEANIAVASAASFSSIGTGLTGIDLEDTDFLDWDATAGTLSVTAAGLYQIKFGSDWDVDLTSTGYMQVALLAEAGATVDDLSLSLHGSPVPANGVDYAHVGVHGLVFVPAGTIYTPSAQQTTGSSRNITGAELWVRAVV